VSVSVGLGGNSVPIVSNTSRMESNMRAMVIFTLRQGLRMFIAACACELDAVFLALSVPFSLPIVADAAVAAASFCCCLRSCCCRLK
jgi:hypothetical protein